MKPYNTDFLEADNNTESYYSQLNYSSIKLAKAIWYVNLCRMLQMPNRLQQRIIRCISGSSHLWAFDIKDVITQIIEFPNRCRECSYSTDCLALHYREKRFLNNRLVDFYNSWSDMKLRDQALRRAAKYQSQNIFALDITDRAYPAKLLNISGYPAILFCEGDGMRYLNQTPLRITIVGTREPTPYGLKATEMITAALSVYDCAIISGLAKGVDALVHQTTIVKGGFTAAVTAGSTDIYYPYQNKNLQQKISEKGVIISEHPPGTKPVKYYFPARNRILSGLADVIIVTESPNHSGTLITTSFATDQNRDVYAVPGNIIQSTSRGCNRLIMDGAALLDEPSQIIERYSLEMRSKQADKFNKLDPTCSKPTEIDLIDNEKLIITCLSSHAMNADELAAELKITIDKVTALLTGLELKNRIRRIKGQYFLTYE